MAVDSRKYEHKYTSILRDTRPSYMLWYDWLIKKDISTVILMTAALTIIFLPQIMLWGDVIFVFGVLYFWWLMGRDRQLPFKFPMGATIPDKNNGRGGAAGKAEGILYLGNVKDTNEEVWFTNSDARTHILYLGTTGAGKTEGLKSMVANALSWGSGFVYVDGKADTDLWSSLSSLCRRFGRDDDLLVLNYMTGNAEGGAPSNTMNPFSSGSSSYLVNMLTNLMPESEGDNAMWKERAVSLISAILPALVWKRDHLDIPLFVTSIRDSLNLNKIIALAREEVIPDEVRSGVRGYLDTLPGYQDAAFDDAGQQKPPGADVPQVDMNTMSNQHGFLTMQLTRALQSLGEDYGYIFNTPTADVDMNDVVLNRRILVVLIPALEKSGDEIANLGKIIAANMKGMMGSALGATLEGDQAVVIDNKPATSSTPFMTVFDEVGYYTAAGMAVMAAQARSLGFCLIFSGQDLPAMKKRVKEEANSITANCNIKIFGKLEDPTETKEFFEKTVGQGFFTEIGTYTVENSSSYMDNKQASVQLRARASYDGLREMKEGEAVICFAAKVYDTKMFYSNPGFGKAMRVTRFLGLPPPTKEVLKFAPQIRDLRDRLMHKKWTAEKAAPKSDTAPALRDVLDGLEVANKNNADGRLRGILGLGNLYAASHVEEVRGMIHPDQAKQTAAVTQPAEAAPPPVAAEKQGDDVKDTGGGGPAIFGKSKVTPPPAAEGTSAPKEVETAAVKTPIPPSAARRHVAGFGKPVIGDSAEEILKKAALKARKKIKDKTLSDAAE